MIEEKTIEMWVSEADAGPKREFREAVRTILSSIAQEPDLRASMVIKGGILLAIRYQSYRYTKDIDFSTNKVLSDIDKDEIVEKLNHSMALMAESLEYDLDCRVQSCKIQPANRPDANFPSIKMKIGYAYKHEARHKRLIAGKCPTTIDIDYSLNELMPNIEEYEIGEGQSLTAYSLTDLIAEKLRSVLQQVKRDRQRRQDIFDLYLLIGKFPDLDSDEKARILESLIVKAHSREIDPHSDSFKDKEVRNRSRAQYHTLADEIEGELPDFDEIYSVVQKFYESLPWK